MKRILLLFCLAFAGIAARAQTHNSGDIQWMSFSEAVKKCETQPKKLFIDVYTSWCGWCKRMDATTFKDPSVAAFMNKYFYAVKLDAETRDTIIFQDKKFVFRPEYKSNELALSLLSGKMSYPNFVYLDESFGMLATAPGYQSVDQIIPQLKFFGENIYQSKTWDEFSKGLQQ